ncbi:MAG: hypothetical protein Q4E21_07785 [Clostridia bacterium]|nr:hypothetical protein [Clostridia bacterium]
MKKAGGQKAEICPPLCAVFSRRERSYRSVKHKVGEKIVPRAPMKQAEKKKSAETLLMEKTSADVQDAGRSDSDKIITNPAEKVNKTHKRQAEHKQPSPVFHCQICN